jgi:predicted acyl esterase
MIIEKDVVIPMSDGTGLRANVYRPPTAGPHPVVMSFGVYGKDIHFADGFTPQWKKLNEIYPGIVGDGSSGEHLRWEVPDPERWVPDGFIIVVVDGRGSGMSPGFLDVYSPRETRDYYECIEWAGTQPWSNGKVGLLGISYLAIKQWQVAALQPPHLAAIVPWEGASDFYRDAQRHGGIFSNAFNRNWWPRQILANQHGNGQTTHRDRATGKATTGKPLSLAILRGNRSEFSEEMDNHPLDDAWHRDHSAKLDNVRVPLLSAANWGGMGVHLRGNVEGYLQAGSKEKWLFGHIGTHYESFYLPHYVAIQKRFFDHYLKGLDNGWEKEPRVQLAIRQPDGTAAMRKEHEWPLARTKWTPYFLDAAANRLTLDAPSAQGQASYSSPNESATFLTEPFTQDVEFTGPVSLKLWISSTTSDADIFAVLRIFDPEGKEVTFTGAHEAVPVGQGWLRASHRKLDLARTLPYRPYHTHDEVQKLVPGQVYPLDVEIWPTSMVYRKGYRLCLTVQGGDFVVDKPGRLLHDDPVDRNTEDFGGVTTIHTGAKFDSHMLMPMIPTAS